MPGRNINDQQVRTYMRLRTDHPQMTAAAKAGLSVATARRIDLDPRPPSAKKQRRTWRTRPDPLEGLWDEEILPLLVAAPGLRPITLFDEMERRHPGRIGPSFRRTLERRIAEWKALHGANRAVMFPQIQQPGRMGRVRTKVVRSSGDTYRCVWRVGIGRRGRVGGQRGPVGRPIAVQAVDPQREHVFRVLDEPPGAGKLQALLRDITMRAFDFSGADRKSFGEGLAIVQLASAGAEIAMADADRSLLVAHIQTFAMGKQRAENRAGAPRPARPFAPPSRLSPRRGPARLSSPPRSDTRKHDKNR